MVVAAGIALWCPWASASSWEVIQTATLGSGTNTTTLSQANNQGAYQAINAIMLDSGSTVAKATQTVTVNGNLTLEQGAGNDNRQAANLIEAGTVIDAEQSVTAEQVSLNRTASGSGNYQTLNMVLASTVGDLSQGVAISQLTFATSGGNNNIQAGNLVVTANAWTSIDQSLVSTGTVAFAEDTGTKNLQAGNAIITGQAWNSGTTTMQFSATNVDSSYSAANGAGGSIKAANYYGPPL